MRLGPITFQDFEVASGVSFGGRQVMAAHRLGNGTRVIDLLGPEGATISFSGAFSGGGAVSRARSVDLLRAQGIQVTLSWDSFSYLVVISAFDAVYENQTWIPYRVRCTVFQDDSTISIGAGLTDSLGLDLVGAMTELATAIPDLSVLATEVSVNQMRGIASGSATVVAADDAISVRLATQERAFGDAVVALNSSPAEAPTALQALGSSIGSTSALISARAYLRASEAV